MSAEIPIVPEIIETERVRLRPWKFGDVDDVVAYAQDPEWARFLHAIPLPYEPHHAEEFLARQFLLDRKEHAAWAVEVDGSAVGGINLRFLHDHRIGEIGYSIAQRLWNRGYVTEAAGAVIDAAFRTYPELVRIRAFADVRNAPSQRVMEKLGMRKEGILRQNRYEREQLVDEAWWGMLRGEWEAARG